MLSPAIGEMLGALGLLDRVVGIGQFGPWPGTIARLPVVGGYNDPNIEQVLTLDADLVLNADSQAAMSAHRRLRAMGIEVMALDSATYEGVFRSLKILGEKFDRRTAAERITARIRGQIAEVGRLAKHLDKKRVVFVVGRDPIYVAGPGSHVDRLIRLAGGENVAGDMIAPYRQISLEAILERRPEVIIDSSDNGRDALRGRHHGAWGQWLFLPAVRDNRVYWIDPSQLVIPGIRLAHMARLMGKLIHPKVFGEPDAQDFEKLTIADDGTSR